MSNTITLRVNARQHTAAVEPRTHLADFLREDLLLTGTHLGCEHGVCGACTLMLDGRPVRACLTSAASCDGADVRTVEGFEADALMAALRRAFTRHHALQCGYCTPGMLVTAYDVVRRLPGADEARIRAELAGNLCRCTGYAGIVAAIADVLTTRPEAELQPMQRAAPAAPRAAPLPAAALPRPDRAPGPAIPETIDGTKLTRDVALDLPADAVWPLLRDIRRVVACVPGAAVDDVTESGIDGRLIVSIGPMRAAFRGRARVVTDDATRTGTVAGAAVDPATRSTAEGILAFRLAERGADGCDVHADITYRLKGPLAQFGRPAIVSEVVDRLMGQFAANLAAAATGRAVDARPIGGLRLMAGTAWALLRRLLRRG